MQPIWLERRKWPDIPHYGHPAHPLGEDEHGRWFELKVGDPVYRGTELLFHGKDGGLMLLPHGDECWLAWFPAAPRFQLYVDIVCQIERREGHVTMVDLDFDVIRFGDGRVELVDEDEFAEHRIRYGYPDDVSAAAIAASRTVLSAVEAGEPPFDGVVAAVWAERAGLRL